jgi:hypothetical protein
MNASLKRAELCMVAVLATLGLFLQDTQREVVLDVLCMGLFFRFHDRCLCQRKCSEPTIGPPANSGGLFPFQMKAATPPAHRSRSAGRDSVGTGGPREREAAVRIKELG